MSDSDEKRISARIDSVRAYFMAEYKSHHKDKNLNDTDILKDALDALKEKENKKVSQDIRKQEEKIFQIIGIISSLNEYRGGDQEKYLEVLRAKLREIGHIAK